MQYIVASVFSQYSEEIFVVYMSLYVSTSHSIPVMIYCFVTFERGKLV